MFKEAGKGVDDGGETLGEAEQSRRAGLGHQHAARIEPGLGDGIELFGVEQGRRAALQGVNQVEDDSVVGVRSLFQVSPGVFVNQIGAGVVEAALVVVGEVFLAKLDHFRVQVDHGGPLNGLVGQHFTESAPFTPSANEHLLGAGVAEHGGVHQGLVVDVLVPFRGLGLAV